MTYLALILLAACIVLGFFLYVVLMGHEAQIRDLLEEREELLTEIVRLQRGNHPAGRALRVQRTDEPWCGEVTWGRTGEVIEIDATDALRKALEARDAEHEDGA